MSPSGSGLFVLKIKSMESNRQLENVFFFIIIIKCNFSNSSSSKLNMSKFNLHILFYNFFNIIKITNCI